MKKRILVLSLGICIGLSACGIKEAKRVDNTDYVESTQEEVVQEVVVNTEYSETEVETNLAEVGSYAWTTANPTVDGVEFPLVTLFSDLAAKGWSISEEYNEYTDEENLVSEIETYYITNGKSPVAVGVMAPGDDPEPIDNCEVYSISAYRSTCDTMEIGGVTFDDSKETVFEKMGEPYMGIDSAETQSYTWTTADYSRSITILFLNGEIDNISVTLF